MLTLGASNNTVGGGRRGGKRHRRRAEDGVDISNGASNNVVIGNRIGTNAAGAAALANGWYGVDIIGPATGNTVGGTTAPATNIISGNSLGGVHISSAGASGNAVEEPHRDGRHRYVRHRECHGRGDRRGCDE